MDSSLVKAEAFFFIASIGFILIGLLIAVGLFYILNILHMLRKIVKAAQEGAESVVEGIHEAKQNMKEEGYVVGSLIDVFKRLAYKKKGRRASK